MEYWILGLEMDYGEGNDVIGIKKWDGKGVDYGKMESWLLKWILEDNEEKIVYGEVEERCK